MRFYKLKYSTKLQFFFYILDTSIRTSFFINGETHLFYPLTKRISFLPMHACMQSAHSDATYSPTPHIIRSIVLFKCMSLLSSTAARQMLRQGRYKAEFGVSTSDRWCDYRGVFIIVSTGINKFMMVLSVGRS